jgi:hypothetical protein
MVVWGHMRAISSKPPGPPQPIQHNHQKSTHRPKVESRNHFRLLIPQSFQHGTTLCSLNGSNDIQVLGRVIHIGVDAILVSTVLAGIKRSTGLQ